LKTMQFVLFLTGFIAATSGAIAAEYKIGFVNTERILREAAPAVKAQKKLEKEFSARDQELQKMAQQLKDLQAVLDKEGSVMSEADRRNKEQDLARQSRDFQRMQREYREDFNLRKNEELAAILEKGTKVIQAIAESEKFDLILQEAVYKSPKIDITDKVLKVLAEEK
jgi:outer membrane protein